MAPRNQIFGTLSRKVLLHISNSSLLKQDVFQLYTSTGPSRAAAFL